MENASKALLMAGGIILTILVFSLLLYAWASIQEYQSNQQKMLEVEELTEFNLKFTNYERNDVKGYELLTLVNKVIDYNQRYSEAGATTSSAAGNSMQFSPITVNIKLDNPGEDTKRNELTGEITVPAVAKAAYKNDTYTVIKSTNTKYETAEITYNKEIIGYDTNYRLFKKASYLQSNTINQFQNDVLNVIYGYQDDGGITHDGIEKDFGGSIKAQNLVKSISTIFESKVIDYNGQPDDKDGNGYVDASERSSWYQKNYIENRYKTLTGKSKPISDIRHEDNVIKILQYYEFVEFKKVEFKCTGITYNQNTGRVASLSFEMK